MIVFFFFKFGEKRLFVLYFLLVCVVRDYVGLLISKEIKMVWNLFNYKLLCIYKCDCERGDNCIKNNRKEMGKYV